MSIFGPDGIFPEEDPLSRALRITKEGAPQDATRVQQEGGIKKPSVGPSRSPHESRIISDYYNRAEKFNVASDARWPTERLVPEIGALIAEAIPPGSPIGQALAFAETYVQLDALAPSVAVAPMGGAFNRMPFFNRMKVVEQVEPLNPLGTFARGQEKIQVVSKNKEFGQKLAGVIEDARAQIPRIEERVATSTKARAYTLEDIQGVRKALPTAGDRTDELANLLDDLKAQDEKITALARAETGQLEEANFLANEVLRSSAEQLHIEGLATQNAVTRKMKRLLEDPAFKGITQERARYIAENTPADLIINAQDVFSAVRESRGTMRDHILEAFLRSIH